MAWPEQVISDFREAASRELRWIVMGGIYNTGFRSVTARNLPRVHLESDGVRTRIRKNGHVIFIPYTDELRAIRDEMPKDQLLAFTDEKGRAWDEHRLRHKIADTLAACGHKGYGAHGLRVRAGEVLFEIGADPEDIREILGHRLYTMTAHYVRGASRAKRAVAKLDEHRRKRRTRTEQG